MSFTKLDICSQALVLIRANPISSFLESSDAAAVCNILYNSFIKDIFSRYPWSFSKKTSTLARYSGAPIKKYKYAYAMPNDCLRVWGLYSGDKLVEDYEICGENLDNKAHSIPLILSNEESLTLDYNASVSEDLWPGYFLNYAIYALADLLAGPITDDDTIVDKMHRLAYGAPNENEKGGKFAIAAYNDSQQNPSKSMDCDILIASRFS